MKIRVNSRLFPILLNVTSMVAIPVFRQTNPPGRADGTERYCGPPGCPIRSPGCPYTAAADAGTRSGELYRVHANQGDSGGLSARELGIRSKPHFPGPGDPEHAG